MVLIHHGDTESTELLVLDERELMPTPKQIPLESGYPDAGFCGRGR